MKTIEISSCEDIQAAAQEFISCMGNSRIFLFTGKMGAGKTTFIKAICRELGVSETVNSPTFSIVNEYAAQNGEIIYHFDFYRINTINEAKDIGVEDYFYSGNICFLEWAENITPLLPDSAVNIKITELDSGKRIVAI
jgi:tRNA threonylcarbamoyladenosine biosynthesis protein TsaE